MTALPLLARAGQEKDRKLAFQHPKLEFTRKIWAQAPHSAFTDLEYFKGYWYCTFREANAHGSEDGYGKIRVIRSADTYNWRSVCLIGDTAFDLRDPKIITAPGGRLMLTYTGARLLNPPGAAELKQYFEPKVCFSYNGKKWGRPHHINIRNQVPWRVVWHKNMAYTVGWHRETGAVVYASKDGVRYRKISRLKLDGFPNETSLLFGRQDKMIAMVRREAKPNSVYVGESKPPYTAWKFDTLNTYTCGPNMAYLPDSSILSTYRCYDNGVPRLCLAQLDGRLMELLNLPSGGDCGYAGMYWLADALWVSYYSSHEGKASIYLSKIVFAPQVSLLRPQPGLKKPTKGQYSLAHIRRKNSPVLAYGR